MAIKTIHDADALLLYRVGPVYCCSPSLVVEAVIMPPKLTHPPGTTDAEPGVFKTVQGIVKAVDLRKRFGVDKEDWSDPGRIIIIEIEGGHAGLWVDDIVDVIQFPQKGWADVPAAIPKRVFSRTLLLNDVVQLYADFEKIYNFRETGYLRKHIENLKSIKEKELSEQKESLKAVNYPVIDGDNDHGSLHEDISESVGLGLQVIKTVSKEVKSIDLSKSVVDERKIKPLVYENKLDKSSFSIDKKESINNKAKSLREDVKKEQEKILTKVTNKQYIEKVNLDSEMLEKQADINKLNNSRSFSDLGLFLILCVLAALLLVGGYKLFDMPAKSVSEIMDVPSNAIAIKKSVEKIENDTVMKAPEALPEELVVEKNASEVLGEDSESASTFHADIQENDEGLVIVLTQSMEVDEPALASVLVLREGRKSVIEESSKREEGALKESSLDKIKQQKLKNEEEKIKQTTEINKQIEKVIVHVVVKGDTLWYIAKRYINNPFRYPELARLSHIKNPDLIYPGNKVKIIFKSSK
jgi:chemotaxis signal transduction protein/LysM repeat protein